MTNQVHIHPLKVIFHFLILMSVTFEKMWISCNPYAGERDFQSR